MASKRDILASEIQEAREAKDATDKKALELLVSFKAQVEYINHLVFILGPHLNKLLEALDTEITTLPGEVGLEVKLPMISTVDAAVLATNTSIPVVDRVSNKMMLSQLGN